MEVFVYDKIDIWREIVSSFFCTVKMIKFCIHVFKRSHLPSDHNLFLWEFWNLFINGIKFLISQKTESKIKNGFLNFYDWKFVRF